MEYEQGKEMDREKDEGKSLRIGLRIIRDIQLVFIRSVRCLLDYLADCSSESEFSVAIASVRYARLQ